MKPLEFNIFISVESYDEKSDKNDQYRRWNISSHQDRNINTISLLLTHVCLLEI